MSYRTFFKWKGSEVRIYGPNWHGNPLYKVYVDDKLAGACSEQWDQFAKQYIEKQIDADIRRNLGMPTDG